MNGQNLAIGGALAVGATVLTAAAIKEKAPAIKDKLYGKIGCLGEIPFYVSHFAVQTVNNASWAGGARYATHQRHLTNALTEFTGVNPDTFSFDFLLCYELGVDPLSMLNKLWKYERDGAPVSLILGEKAYGKYRWIIQKHTAKMQYYDKDGNLIMAEVSVELLEYLRE